MSATLPDSKKETVAAKRVSNPEIIVLAELAKLMDELPTAEAQARALCWLVSTYGSDQLQIEMARKLASEDR